MPVIDLDFTDAPPSEGGGLSDRVPEGDYRLRITKIESRNTSTGKPMMSASFVIADGQQVGKRLVDQFVLPRPRTDDSKVGLQRFHMLLVAAGMKQQAGRAKINTDNLVNKVVEATVEDRILQASNDGRYPERTISSPVVYRRRQPATGAQANAERQQSLRPVGDADNMDVAEPEEVVMEDIAPPANAARAAAARRAPAAQASPSLPPVAEASDDLEALFESL